MPTIALISLTQSACNIYKKFEVKAAWFSSKTPLLESVIKSYEENDDEDLRKLDLINALSTLESSAEVGTGNLKNIISILNTCCEIQQQQTAELKEKLHTSLESYINKISPWVPEFAEFSNKVVRYCDSFGIDLSDLYVMTSDDNARLFQLEKLVEEKEQAVQLAQQAENNMRQLYVEVLRNYESLFCTSEQRSRTIDELKAENEKLRNELISNQVQETQVIHLRAENKKLESIITQLKNENAILKTNLELQRSPSAQPNALNVGSDPRQYHSYSAILGLFPAQPTQLSRAPGLNINSEHKAKL